MQNIRVMVVDADGIFRSGIGGLLGRTTLAGSRIEALETLPEDLSALAGYDLLLLDDGGFTTDCLITTIRTLLEQHPGLRIIVLSQRLIISHIQQVVRSGALGFIHKQDNLEHALVLGVNSVCRDLVYLSSRVSERLATVNQYLSVGDLTPFDLQVLHRMAEGCTIPEIMLHLSTSRRSVYRAREKLREVLNVSTNDQVVDAARQQGLLDDM